MSKTMRKAFAIGLVLALAFASSTVAGKAKGTCSVSPVVASVGSQIVVETTNIFPQGPGIPYFWVIDHYPSSGEQRVLSVEYGAGTGYLTDFYGDNFSYFRWDTNSATGHGWAYFTVQPGTRGQHKVSVEDKRVMATCAFSVP